MSLITDSWLGSCKMCILWAFATMELQYGLCYERRSLNQGCPVLRVMPPPLLSRGHLVFYVAVMVIKGALVVSIINIDINANSHRCYFGSSSVSSSLPRLYLASLSGSSEALKDRGGPGFSMFCPARQMGNKWELPCSKTPKIPFLGLFCYLTPQKGLLRMLHHRSQCRPDIIVDRRI